MTRTISRARCEQQMDGKATTDIAEIIAVRFNVAIHMTKQVGTKYEAPGKIRVKELALQLRSLANYADAGFPDNYPAVLSEDDKPLFMRLHNVPADLLQEITDELAKQDEWLSPTIAELNAGAYMDALPPVDLGTRFTVSGGEVMELDTPQPEAGNEDLPF